MRTGSLQGAADGDAPVAEGLEEFLQEIRLESMTQEGDLFYDPEYGWSLLDFIQRDDSEADKVGNQDRIRREDGEASGSGCVFAPNRNRVFWKMF